MTAITILLTLCWLAVIGLWGYVVISGLFVWPPAIPTTRRTRRLMIEAVHRFRPEGVAGGLILDPGCGFGGLTLAMARAFPDSQTVGIDLLRLPLLLARLRARLGHIDNVTFRRGDLFAEDYRNAQVIVCFLFGNLMKKLGPKWNAELPDGCLVVSNYHPVPQWEPTEVIPVPDWRTFGRRNIYVYRLPEARTQGAPAV